MSKIQEQPDNSSISSGKKKKKTSWCVILVWISCETAWFLALESRKWLSSKGSKPPWRWRLRRPGEVGHQERKSLFSYFQKAKKKSHLPSCFTVRSFTSVSLSFFLVSISLLLQPKVTPNTLQHKASSHHPSLGPSCLSASARGCIHCWPAACPGSANSSMTVTHDLWVHKQPLLLHTVRTTLLFFPWTVLKTTKQRNQTRWSPKNFTSLWASLTISCDTCRACEE